MEFIIKDKPGALDVKVIRFYFEKAVNDTAVFKENIRLEWDGDRYRCPKTQRFFAGFAIGMRTAERINL